MKDKDFKDLKNYKIKPTENKINNTNRKDRNCRTEKSRLKSTDKSINDEKFEVNKKFSRALSSNFKFHMANDLMKKKESEKFIRNSERKNTVGKSLKKK